MKRAEAEFRRIEKKLDEFVKMAEHELGAAGISAEDRSARTYHYKNDHLFWSYSFRKEWHVGIETARITVWLRHYESNCAQIYTKVNALWRAELFQQGRESRINKRGERVLPLSELEQMGIFSFVLSAIAESAKCLPKAI